MPTIQEQIDAIIGALGNNKLTVTGHGRSVTYKSAADMREALDILREEQARQSGAGGQSLGVYSRG